MAAPACISDVLRIRRHQPPRLEDFGNAPFAFAVTALASSIDHVPSSMPAMVHALRGLIKRRDAKRLVATTFAA
jgi:hypothetical protein